jgi:hypothetical protein
MQSSPSQELPPSVGPEYSVPLLNQMSPVHNLPRYFSEVHYNVIFPSMPESRDSVVGIATGYELDDQEVGVRVLVGAKIITSPCGPDRFWVHPTSYPMGTGGKAAGAWSWPLTSS